MANGIRKLEDGWYWEEPIEDGNASYLWGPYPTKGDAVLAKQEGERRSEWD